MYTASCWECTNFSLGNIKKNHGKVARMRNWSLLQISYKSHEHEDEDKNKVPDFLWSNSSFSFSDLRLFVVLWRIIAALSFFLIHSIKLLIRGSAVVDAKAPNT